MPSVPSKEYWIKRAEDTLIAGEKSALAYEKDLEKAYKQTIALVKKEIDAFYGRYAKDTGISLAEARRRLDKNELKDFQSSAKKYLEEVEKAGPNIGIEPYRSYLKELSGKAYVSRIQELTTNIRHHIELNSVNYEKGLKGVLENGYEDGYYRTLFDVQKQAGFGVDFAAPGAKLLDKSVREKWLGRNYSDSIWEDKKRLVNTMEQLLSQEFVRGRGSREVAKVLADKLGVSFSNAQRLLRTEINYISNKGTMQAYKDSGVVQSYEFVATLDSRTSEICRDLDGKVFALNEAKVGINLPPLHPYCRSTTVPHFPDDEIGKTVEDRVARDENGHTYKVGKDVTFHEWTDNYAEGAYAKRVKRTPKVYDAMDKAPEVLMPNTFTGLKQEKLEGFDFEMYRDKNGYGVELAHAASGMQAEILYENGKPIAFAYAEEEDNKLRLYNMAGFKPKAGTEIFISTMEKAKSLNKPLSWAADDDEAKAYYKHLGLDKYAERTHYGLEYSIPASKLDEVIAKLSRKYPKKYIVNAGIAEAPPQPAQEPLPKTLLNLEEHERKWYEEKILNVLDDHEVQAINDSLKKLVDNNDLAMRVPDFTILEKIIEGGFKTQLETNTSNGSLDARARKDATAQLFGIERNEVENFDPSDFEKYGYLASRDINLDFSEDNDASQYGKVCVRFKRERVSHRTTMTVDDSLGPAMGERVIATPVTNPKVTAVVTNHYYDAKTRLPDYVKQNLKEPHRAIDAVRGRYFELQYHGKLTIDDVESITYKKGRYPVEPSSKMGQVIQKVKDLGIKVYEAE